MSMKKIMIVLLVAMGLLSSCNIHTSDNGDLDGQWYLVQVDSLQNGVQVPFREKRVFWAITGSLMFTQAMPRDPKKEYVYKFEREGNTLCIGDAYRSDRVKGDEPITEDRLDELKPYGINALREVFAIQTLNSDDLVLQGNILRLHFEKY